MADTKITDLTSATAAVGDELVINDITDTSDKKVTAGSIVDTITGNITVNSLGVSALAANVVDSSELVNGSVDLSHMSVNSIDSDQYVDASIDLAHMSVNSIDSDQYVDASIDLAHMSVNSIDSDQYVDGSIDAVHLVAGLSPIGVHDFYVGATGMWPSTTAGPAALAKVELASGQDINTLDFDTTTQEYAQFELTLPRNYNNGTITFRVYWSSTAADTDGVTWGVEAVALGDGEVLTTAWGTRIDVDDLNQSVASDTLITAESAALTIANTPADSNLVRFKVSRVVGDANDTATEDARLHGVAIHFTTDAAVAA